MQPDRSLPQLAAEYGRIAAAWHVDAAGHRRIADDSGQKRGTRLVAERLADRAVDRAGDWAALADLAEAAAGGADEARLVAACQRLAAGLEGYRAA